MIHMRIYIYIIYAYNMSHVEYMIFVCMYINVYPTMLKLQYVDLKFHSQLQLANFSESYIA